MLSTPGYFFLNFKQLQDKSNGQPKLKRRKTSADDLGMTSSDSDDQGIIYGALVVLG